LQGQTDKMPQLNSAIDRDLQKPTSYPHADAVNVSPEIAERRADLGKDASLGQLQAFDGPAPETINGEPQGVVLVASQSVRLCGVVSKSMHAALSMQCTLPLHALNQRLHLHLPNEVVTTSSTIRHCQLCTADGIAAAWLFPCCCPSGRLCMLAVPLALWWEAQYGLDIVAQVTCCGSRDCWWKAPRGHGVAPCRLRHLLLQLLLLA
jgi:hypothetical protein